MPPGHSSTMETVVLVCGWSNRIKKGAKVIIEFPAFTAVKFPHFQQQKWDVSAETLCSDVQLSRGWEQQPKNRPLKTTLLYLSTTCFNSSLNSPDLPASDDIAFWSGIISGFFFLNDLLYLVFLLTFLLMLVSAWLILSFGFCSWLQFALTNLGKHSISPTQSYRPYT